MVVEIGGDGKIFLYKNGVGTKGHSTLQASYLCDPEIAHDIISFIVKKLKKQQHRHDFKTICVFSGISLESFQSNARTRKHN